MLKILIALLLLLNISCSKTALYEYPSSTSKSTAINSFRLVNETVVNVVSGTPIIDKDAGTVLVKVNADTDLTKLYPSAVVSEGVIVEPSFGYQTDFSQPVQYRLLAGDRQTDQIWTITVTF